MCLDFLPGHSGHSIPSSLTQPRCRLPSQIMNMLFFCIWTCASVYLLIFIVSHGDVETGEGVGSVHGYEAIVNSLILADSIVTPLHSLHVGEENGRWDHVLCRSLQLSWINCNLKSHSQQLFLILAYPFNIPSLFV